jgi:phage protein D
MLKPAYQISVGGRTLDSTSQPRASTLVTLTVTLDADTPVSVAEMFLGQVGGSAPELGDAITIQLGYADDPKPDKVFTGTVVRIEPGITVNRVIAHDCANPLLQTFLDQTFLDTNAGAIVRDLVGRTKVVTGTVEEGIGLPAYVVDGRRSLLWYIRELAEFCGFDCYTDADGSLVFASFSGSRTAQVLRYAEHILELNVDRRASVAPRVQAWGESPGASRGDDSWAWLTKDFTRYRGEAGTGDPVRLLQRSALRTAKSAATAATALHDRLAREALRGDVHVLGDASMKLGDAVRLSATPRDDGTYRIRRVVHRLSKSDGFTTTVGFTALDGGGTT